MPSGSGFDSIFRLNSPHENTVADETFDTIAIRKSYFFQANIVLFFLCLTVLSRVLCGVILFLCCVGTVWDIVLDCFQPQTTESDGMPQSTLADGEADTRVKKTDTEILIPPSSAESKH